MTLIRVPRSWWRCTLSLVARQPLNDPPLSAIRDEDLVAAFDDIDNHVEHPFDEPTKFYVMHEGVPYAAKAVVGLAYRRMAGKWPDYLSAGPQAIQAQGLLERRGYEIVEKSEVARTGGDWSRQEVELLVADYFAMLREELLGSTYRKADHRRRLIPLLDGRSTPSVEYKYANMSAVLLELGAPYISGYKPRGNYQALLGEAVREYLVAHPTFFDALIDGPVINPAMAPSIPTTTAGVFVAPPQETFAPPESSEPWKSRRGRKIDMARRDAENRRLGRLGEEFTVALERKRLIEAGRNDLAARIEWVADTRGDGLGFDILSFTESDDSERYVEAKTTGSGKHTPFIVTANEVNCSNAEPKRFHLYRLFDFSKQPRLFVLHGRLTDRCALRPLAFRATPNGS